MNKKSKLKLIVLTVTSVVAMFAATSSAGACWIFALHQPKCPESLLK